MDLRLFWGVAKRFKAISIGGLVLATVLAVFAYGTPGPHGIKPRGSVTWESQAELLITQGNGPYGRADAKTVQIGDPSYMSSLSPVYAGIANGTAVQHAVQTSGIPGKVTADEGLDQNTGLYTPFVTLTATAPSKADAAALSRRAITSFQNYLAQMEAATNTPANARVSLEVIKNGLPPVISAKPKPTIPILVFIAVIAGAIMLMFSLENRDPRTAAALGRISPHGGLAAAPGTPYGGLPNAPTASIGRPAHAWVKSTMHGGFVTYSDLESGNQPGNGKLQSGKLTASAAEQAGDEPESAEQSVSRG